MGKSESIKRKMQDEERHRNFMDILENDSNREEDRILMEINSRAGKYYGANGWEYARLFGDKRSDYQNYGDWSLKRIISVITAIGNEISNGNIPSVVLPGSEGAQPSAINLAKDFSGAFMTDYQLIMARVQAIVTAAIARLSVPLDERITIIQDIPLSAGLHLFIGISGSVSTGNPLFTNEFIGSFQIVYEVYVSLDEARAVKFDQILKITSEELNTVIEQIVTIREEAMMSIKKILRENPNNYVSTIKAYNNLNSDLRSCKNMLIEEYTKY